jgi:D-xylose transport system substrate-binding protein
MVPRLVPGVVALALVLLAGCGGDEEAASRPPVAVAVLLPETVQPRWEVVDRGAFLSGFAREGVPTEVFNAGGDPALQLRHADDVLRRGAGVLVVAAVDGRTGAEVVRRARARRVPVVAYERTIPRAGTDFLVAPDRVRAGQLQVQGLAGCAERARRGGGPARIAVLGGPAGDPDARLVRRGQREELRPLVRRGAVRVVAERRVPATADPARAAAAAAERLLRRAGGRVDGVLAGDEALANAAVDVLRARGVPAPVAGLGASVPTVQNVVTGATCVSVRTPAAREADSAVRVATALARRASRPRFPPPPPAFDERVDDGRRRVPAVLSEPVPLTREVLAEQVPEPDVPDAPEVCTGPIAPACPAAGL